MFAAPALAQGYAAKQLGDWTVAASQDGSGCFISRSFGQPGGTRRLLGMDRDGSNHFSVLNETWSIRPQDRLKLTFRLTRGGYIVRRRHGWWHGRRGRWAIPARSGAGARGWSSSSFTARGWQTPQTLVADRLEQQVGRGDDRK
ncbi:hypothetical protein ABIC65_003778 [Sphingomonas trueperi]|uniref:hypothetical protein n=1 Tax=Sphingomonas trueperi TaxID=53317 RepID=UPI003393F560